MGWVDDMLAKGPNCQGRRIENDETLVVGFVYDVRSTDFVERVECKRTDEDTKRATFLVVGVREFTVGRADVEIFDVNWDGPEPS